MAGGDAGGPRPEDIMEKSLVDMPTKTPIRLPATALRSSPPSTIAQYAGPGVGQAAPNGRVLGLWSGTPPPCPEGHGVAAEEPAGSGMNTAGATRNTQKCLLFGGVTC